MASLSLNFIVKNEGAYAVNMIKSVVDLVDVVCFVDTGSTDGSVGVIENYLTEAGVKYFKLEDDFVNFSDARNKSLDLIPSNIDNVLILDCDEAIDRAYHDRLIKLIGSGFYGFDGCLLPRINYRNNEEPLGYPDLQLRVFKNKGFRYSGDVHEMPQGGEWFFPGESDFSELPQISHFKYIQKTDVEILDRELLYQKFYKIAAKKRAAAILHDIATIPSPSCFEYQVGKYLPAFLAENVPESRHQYLLDAVNVTRPKLVCIVGFWRPEDAIIMANNLMLIGYDSPILCVDTWLPRFQHLATEVPLKGLFNPSGSPRLYEGFANVVKNSGLDDYIIPVQLDSHVAAGLFSLRSILFDVVYINLSVDHRIILRDLEDWWPLLSSGGVFIAGSDVFGGDVLQAAKIAFDLFFDTPPEYFEGKFRIYKI